VVVVVDVAVQALVVVVVLVACSPTWAAHFSRCLL
jgi:hypothetical protein